MLLPNVFAALSQYLHTKVFQDHARHPECPAAFTRHRKLTLPTLIAFMLGNLRMGMQAELDQFFAALARQSTLRRCVSEQAFAQARSKLSGDIFAHLNDWLLELVSNHLPRWHGFRLIAADASHLRFAIRHSHLPRAATRDQLAFGLYLPGAEIMLAASLHSVHENERQILFEHLDRLQSDDLLLLDRGYPARWLVAVLNERKIPFCMRADGSGFAAVRHFVRSGRDEAIVTLPAPARNDARDYECAATPQTVRLIRQVSPAGKVRVLITNLLDMHRYPATTFRDLYHQRWRLEEAFKRLKHRMALEHLSGLSQLAARQDFGAKILSDNLHALCCLGAAQEHDVDPSHRINRSYAITALKPVLSAALLGLRWAKAALNETLHLIATRTHCVRPDRAKPRPPRHKPHRHAAYKAC
ncbi:IS4 family transposase [Cupriavidus basilensis]|uniref:IS4 family transposase n=1 Tax=Cupriavidus basilensis TaxID=68895 RepID=UPI0020A6ACA9|nr:IS4 family transposase [Cupriavidus basilensis]MCP3018348.1 IS4 family transposase [Cupriavidus basilensis]